MCDCNRHGSVWFIFRVFVRDTNRYTGRVTFTFFDFVDIEVHTKTRIRKPVYTRTKTRKTRVFIYEVFRVFVRVCTGFRIRAPGRRSLANSRGVCAHVRHGGATHNQSSEEPRGTVVNVLAQCPSQAHAPHETRTPLGLSARARLSGRAPPLDTPQASIAHGFRWHAGSRWGTLQASRSPEMHRPPLSHQSVRTSATVCDPTFCDAGALVAASPRRCMHDLVHGSRHSRFGSRGVRADLAGPRPRQVGCRIEAARPTQH